MPKSDDRARRDGPNDARDGDVERDDQIDAERERADGPLSKPDEYGANEREQTVERERAGRTRLDEAGEVTDAEIEAREQRRDENS